MFLRLRRGKAEAILQCQGMDEPGSRGTSKRGISPSATIKMMMHVRGEKGIESPVPVEVMSLHSTIEIRNAQ
jgi:hypothetical protein